MTKSSSLFYVLIVYAALHRQYYEEKEAVST